jgi:glycerate kinase
MRACPNIRFIGILATGYDVVDLAAAREKGIVVSNVPAYGTEAVGQFAIALLLEITSRVGHHDRAVKQGRWTASPDWSFWEHPLMELAGKTMGIIGFGRIGRTTGRIAVALGMRVIAHDKHPDESGKVPGEYVDLDTLLGKTKLLVACDVDNPLCGPRGASAVFGPQKGADAEKVGILDAALERYARIAAESTGKTHAADSPGAGAAGGLGAGLLFFTDAELIPGVALVLEATRFDARVQKADLVFTGEGRTDFQTIFGKAPVGVAEAAKKHGKTVICISGSLGAGVNEVYSRGIDVVSSITPGPMRLEECMENGASLLADATERVCRALRTGMNMRGIGLTADVY